MSSKKMPNMVREIAAPGWAASTEITAALGLFWLNRPTGNNATTTIADQVLVRILRPIVNAFRAARPCAGYSMTVSIPRRLLSRHYDDHEGSRFRLGTARGTGRLGFELRGWKIDPVGRRIHAHRPCPGRRFHHLGDFILTRLFTYRG